MRTSTETSRPRHPIGVVSRRTGIPADVLRAWERRYEAVAPRRAGAGRRLYSDQDVEKLRLLKLAVDGGRRISDVAEMSLSDLQSLIQEDTVTQTPVRRSRARNGVDSLLSAAFQAVEALDGNRLEDVLSRAETELTRPQLRDELILPLMYKIGDRWTEGEYRVAHEHVASAVVRTFIGNLGPVSVNGTHGPSVVVACPAGQRHELGALLAADAAGERGWTVVFLGADTPAEEIVATVNQRGARAIALSITQPLDDSHVAAELQKIRRLAGDLPILVGGQAVERFQETLDGIGAETVSTLRGLQERLDALNA